MKLLIAGGSSPLGRDLRAELERLGHSTAVLSRFPEDSQIPYSALHSEAADVILNLIGGHKSGLTSQGMNSALKLGQSLVERSSQLGVPLIHLSSGSVLEPRAGPLASYGPLRRPPFQTIYQELKVRLEELHDAWSSRTQILDLRLFSFVGQNFLSNSNYFLSEALGALRSNRELLCNSEDFLRDYSGVAELTASIQIAYEHGVSGKANLFSGAAVSKLSLLGGLRSQFGLKFTLAGRPGDMQHHYHSAHESVLPNFKARGSLEVIVEEFGRALGFEQSKR